MRFPGLLLAALLLPASGVAAEPPKFTTPDEKKLYQWGAGLGDEVANVGATSPGELEWVFRGIRDRVAGRSPPFSAEEHAQLTNYLLGRIEKNGAYEKEQARAYLAARAREPGARVTASGLVYREIVAGKGAKAPPGATVKVEYAGRLRNGWTFDSSRQRGAPLEISLGAVIPCWQEAITLMKVGGKADLACPPELAYADGGSYNIPPGSALSFEVELLAVLP